MIVGALGALDDDWSSEARTAFGVSAFCVFIKLKST